jgi:dTDP-4-dehydrorhamnose reductase
MSKPIVVLGSSGMLGRAFCERLEQQGQEHWAASRAELDLSAPDELVARLTAGTKLVINCGAWTNVDAAETQEREATLINGHAVGSLAEACRAVGARLVHFSSDYVFEGNASTPYAVDHHRAPLNAYGRGKAVGEQLVETSGARYLLIRTSWVYAPWGNNFVLKMLKLARSRPTLRVVSDQLGRPSSAEQIARVVLQLVAQDAVGTYHVTDAGQCSWFDLATAAIQTAGLSCRVEACSSAEYPSPTVRPSYSVLDLDRTVAQVGPLAPWQDGVRDVVSRALAAGL